MSAGQRYIRVVETMDVTAETLERIINEMHNEGFVLDVIRFAMSDASRRPAMAFLIFCNSRLATTAESCATS